MSTTTLSRMQLEIAERFRSTRTCTLALCETLTPEDMMVQSSPETSPAKWHLAHTAWFFESFILREFQSDYRLFNENFLWLFNSYYRTFAEFPEKKLRSSFSRPTLGEILQYRAHVDQAMKRLLEGSVDPEVLKRVDLGANHEEQHQELMLTDILNAFFTNPLRPAYRGVPLEQTEVRGISNAQNFVTYPGGLVEIGHRGDGFCFDNELPKHRVWLEPYLLADRLVTNEEYAEFIADGGYCQPKLWLSAGWDAVEQNCWSAPLYWTNENRKDAKGGDWKLFTLRGEIPLAQLETAPLTHVSYFEADAFARWAGKRLPTEFEWEAAVGGREVVGNLMDSGSLTPVPLGERSKNPAENQFFGDCWEWTASAYLGYPRFEPLGGSLGEYNGKFMSGQMVLRGGSCATPKAHIRSSYRNFFPPETRWQFSGIRLAIK
jgi:ergothioneine biosynthesis protein EgtB